ncbi:MAG TPA: PD-(D/E)XK nuclease family protein [Candidatus Brocadiaceae bacterium]|nr:PD-(D/E)XK nuclease family protein [Candidatus Brocadiaceae bacterium]
MLSVKIGQYHPSLEDSFLKTIHAIKKDDPLAPIAVITPSNLMLQRLQKRLVPGTKTTSTPPHNETCFMNVSFMDFFTLASEINKWAGIEPGRLIRQSFVYESIIEGLLRQDALAGTPFKQAQSPHALARALFQVVQDLDDANVHVDDLKAIIREGFVDGPEAQKIYGIAHLYDLYRQRLRALQISHYSDVYLTATACAPQSPFLEGFTAILAYGFYDLTGVEEDFFREIFRSHPSTLFLPYQKGNPSFFYVKPFFESFVLGLAHDVEEVSSDTSARFTSLLDYKLGSSPVAEGSNDAATRDATLDAPCRLNVQMINASGKKDEVWTVAKEVLRLVEEGYALDEIGVVARTLDPYRDTIRKIFQENYIPFSTTMKEPLERYPMVKVVRQLLLLMRDDYYRPDVITLLSSPYFKMPASLGDTLSPRPDLWDALSRKLGIRGGIQRWLSRLHEALEGLSGSTPPDYEAFSTDENAGKAGERPPSHETENGDYAYNEVSARHIPSGQILLLENIMKALSNDLSSLPERASWPVMSRQVARLLQSYIHIPPEEEGRDRALMGKMLGLLSTVRALNYGDEEVTQELFVDTFLEACRQEGMPLGLNNGGGVQVLDAMSSRGLSFRVLFVLGLNEKVFPRSISEEPFLRDHVRRRLSEVLGNHIPEKLRGFEEERLLFYLLLNAAEEHLYLLYERSDESGKPKVLSHYLMDIIQKIAGTPASAEGNREKQKTYVPRGIKEKICNKESRLLTPKEAGIRMAFDRINPIGFMKVLGMEYEAFERAQRAQRSLEGYHPTLTVYDGIVGDVSPWWNRQAPRGFSPTALEIFGNCPFQFFVKKVLGLEPLEEPERDEMIASVDVGNLCHGILRDFHHYLMREKYFTTRSPETRLEGLLHRVAQKNFHDMEQRLPMPYPILWETKKEEILARLKRFVAWDVLHLEQTGYVPTYLEKTVRLPLADITPGHAPAFGVEEDASAVTFKGKIDRIDIKCGKDGGDIYFRVIDYKTGKPPQDNLPKSAIRGQKLQIPFYIAMTKRLLSEEIGRKLLHQGATKLEEAVFLYLMQQTDAGAGQETILEKAIKGDEWEKIEKQVWETVKAFLHDIRNGIFPVSPTDDALKCAWCDFSTACRRGFQPLQFRLEHDGRLENYRKIITKNLPSQSKGK